MVLDHMIRRALIWRIPKFLPYISEYEARVEELLTEKVNIDEKKAYEHVCSSEPCSGGYI